MYQVQACRFFEGFLCVGTGESFLQKKKMISFSPTKRGLTDRLQTSNKIVFYKHLKKDIFHEKNLFIIPTRYDNGNAMFQSYLSKIFKKETG